MKNNDVYKQEHDNILKGLEEAYRKLILFKKQKNTPLIVSKDGVILEIDANDAPPTTTYYRKII